MQNTEINLQTTSSIPNKSVGLNKMFQLWTLSYVSNSAVPAKWEMGKPLLVMLDTTSLASKVQGLYLLEIIIFQ
jgi:hypothetical protein